MTRSRLHHTSAEEVRHKAQADCPWAEAYHSAKGKGMTDEQAGDYADKKFHEHLQTCAEDKALDRRTP